MRVRARLTAFLASVRRVLRQWQASLDERPVYLSVEDWAEVQRALRYASLSAFSESTGKGRPQDPRVGIWQDLDRRMQRQVQGVPSWR